MPIQPNTQLKGAMSFQGIMSQSGTDDPTMIVIQDDWKGIKWTRRGVGDYIGTKTGKFLQHKMRSTLFGNNFGTTMIPISGSTTGYYQVSPGPNTDYVTVGVFADLAYTPIDLSDIGGTILIQFTQNH